MASPRGAPPSDAVRQSTSSSASASSALPTARRTGPEPVSLDAQGLQLLAGGGVAGLEITPVLSLREALDAL